MSTLRPLALSSHIFVSDADAAVAFYREVFGATELFRNHLPDGRVLFVEPPDLTPPTPTRTDTRM